MNVAVIDTHPQTCNYLDKKFEGNNSVTFEYINCSEADKLSDIANRITQGSYDTVLINIESKFEGANRSDVKGIELIYWLRLKENFLGTIITYGFLSSAQILRLKPEYVVLHAPGNYHLRLPEEIDDVSKYFKVSNISNIEGYREFLKPFGAEKKSRHSDANKWAIKKLISIFNKIVGENIKNNVDKSIFETDSINDIINDVIYKTEILDGSPELNQSIKDNYETLEEIDKKILLIDDMAELGWKVIFTKFLNCKDDDLFTISNVESLSEDEVVNQAVNLIESRNINLILLDLRLKNEAGDVKVEDISGYKLLIKLKNERPDIPIIIVTASNKLLTNKKLKEVGVYDIWTKEGQDNKLTNIDLRHSLLDLLKKVNKVYKELPGDEERELYEIDYRLKTKTYPEKLKDLSTLIFELSKKWKPQLSEIDICILDTNIWISDKAKKDFVKKQIIIQILAEYFNKENKELVIHNFTLSEIRMKAKPVFDTEADSFLVKTANYSLNRIIQMHREDLLSIIDYRYETYDRQAYADPIIIDYALNKLLGNTETTEKGYKQIISKEENAKNILLITDDYGLRFKAQCLRSKHKGKFLITKNLKEIYKDVFE